MALTSTTISGSLDVAATKVAFASAPTVVGTLVKVDDEWMAVSAIDGSTCEVRRGLNGSVQCAHASGAIAVWSATLSDFQGNVPAPRAYTYGAAGAITVAPGTHIIGVGATGAHAMTLADPPADWIGVELHIVSISAQAHTVTLTTGYGGSNATDVFTFSGAIGDSITLRSRNGVWSHMATGLVAADTVSATVA